MARVELQLPKRIDAKEPVTVCTVLHGPGEPVRKGEPVLELINLDGIFDLPAPVTGVIVSVEVEAGAKVRAGTTLLVMESGDRGAQKREKRD